MNEIIKGLYLGGYEDATDSERLRSHGISHILTVHETKLSRSFRKGFQYLFLETRLGREIDLLSRFGDTGEFIRAGVAAGGVLVHCQYGMARSATVAIAFLMREHGRSLQSAFDTVKQRRSVICPGDSFMNQLQLYEHLGCALAAPSRPVLRLYRNYFATVNRPTPDPAKLTFAELDSTDARHYRCGTCDSDLFGDANVGFHLCDDNDIDCLLNCYFDAENDGRHGDCVDGRLYVELMDWMRPQIGAGSGLHCPRCDTDIGKICVSGDACSCGKWMFPSAFIDKLKIVK